MLLHEVGYKLSPKQMRTCLESMSKPQPKLITFAQVWEHLSPVFKFAQKDRLQNGKKIHMNELNVKTLGTWSHNWEDHLFLNNQAASEGTQSEERRIIEWVNETFPDAF